MEIFAKGELVAATVQGSRRSLLLLATRSFQLGVQIHRREQAAVEAIRKVLSAR